MLGLARAKRLHSKQLPDKKLQRFSDGIVQRDVKEERLLEHQQMRRLYREIVVNIMKMKILLTSSFAGPVVSADLPSLKLRSLISVFGVSTVYTMLMDNQIGTMMMKTV
jgi:hypothetical protein